MLTFPCYRISERWFILILTSIYTYILHISTEYLLPASHQYTYKTSHLLALYIRPHNMVSNVKLKMRSKQITSTFLRTFRLYCLECRQLFSLPEWNRVWDSLASRYQVSSGETTGAISFRVFEGTSYAGCGAIFMQDMSFVSLPFVRVGGQELAWYIRLPWKFDEFCLWLGSWSCAVMKEVGINISNILKLFIHEISNTVYHPILPLCF